MNKINIFLPSIYSGSSRSEKIWEETEPVILPATLGINFLTFSEMQQILAWTINCIPEYLSFQKAVSFGLSASLNSSALHVLRRSDTQAGRNVEKQGCTSLWKFLQNIQAVCQSVRGTQVTSSGWLLPDFWTWPWIWFTRCWRQDEGDDHGLSVHWGRSPAEVCNFSWDEVTAHTYRSNSWSRKLPHWCWDADFPGQLVKMRWTFRNSN